MADPGALLGQILELEVGGAAAGGACVARAADGRVVFVRHALPGERVRARVTDDRGGSFCRADAIEVLVAAPQRVAPPCPYAGPGRCGGCDWQHAPGAVQRELKASVIRDQFTRIGRLDLAGVFSGVEELPGGLLGWRTRITFAADAAGRLGLHRHGSPELEYVDRCMIGRPEIAEPPVPDDEHPGVTGVELVTSTDPNRRDAAVLVHLPGRGRQARGRRPPDRVSLVAGPAEITHTVRGRSFAVAAGGFWQVHPAAAEVLTAAVLAATAAAPGETVLDLFAGAGVFTAALADAVGASGRVLGIESDARAVADAERNLAGLPHAGMRRGRVDEQLIAALGERPDVVVLDPPRAGVGAATMRALVDLGPRVIGYVSCDPATLARDVAAARGAGWRLRRLQAFDAFPMTQHVECLATLEPDVASTG